MTEHVFTFTQTVTNTVVIESDAPRDDVEELAWDKLPGSLCHQCARTHEESGDWELVEEESET